MTTVAEPPTPTMANVVSRIPLGELHLPEDNVRSKLGDVAELARSIEAVGILEPIVVTPREKRPYGFLVVCGSRRVAAASAAGLTHVPAIVREFTEEQRIEAMIVENLQREDLTAIEEAEAFQRLVDLGHSQRQLATRLGRSQGHVSKRLALLDLPIVARRAVDSGGITIEQGIELAKISKVAPKRVEKVVADAMRYGGTMPTYIVEQEVRSVLADQEQTRRINKLTDAGKTAVAMTSAYTAPKGLAIVDDAGFNSSVKMKPSKHRRLSCSVVGVPKGPTSGVSEVELCSEPDKHPETVKRQDVGGESKADREWRETTQALEQARVARTAFLEQLCGKRQTKDDLLVILTTAVLVSERWRGDGCAETLLGLVSKEGEGDAAGNPIAEQTVEEWVEGGGDRDRAAMAVALELLDFELDDFFKHRGRELDPPLAPYVWWLERKGYEISPAEKKEIAGRSRT